MLEFFSWQTKFHRSQTEEPSARSCRWSTSAIKTECSRRFALCDARDGSHRKSLAPPSLISRLRQLHPHVELHLLSNSPDGCGPKSSIFFKPFSQKQISWDPVPAVSLESPSFWEREET